MNMSRPLAAIVTIPFFGGSVLFLPAMEKTWVLNDSAAFIWELLLESADALQAARGLSRRYGLPLEQARSEIEATLAGFAAEGLLEGAPQPLSPGSEVACDPVGPKLCLPAVWMSERQIFFAGYALVLRSTEDRIAGHFINLLDGLSAAQPQPGAGERMTLEVVARSDGRGWDIGRDGVLVSRVPEWSYILPALYGILFRALCSSMASSLLLHAAVAVRGERALVLPAVAGSGKSTLVAMLACRGWTFFSDELAVVDSQTQLIAPMPLPLTIKPGSVEPLRGYFPLLSGLAVWDRLDGKQVRYLLPPVESLPSADQRAKAVMLVFPQYSATAAAALEPLEKTEALRALCATGSSDRPLSEADIRALVALVEDAASYRLLFDDAASAVAILERLWAADEALGSPG
jgi:hypothetical protein